MNRELLAKAFGDIDENFVAEAYRPVTEAASGPPERIVHMNRRRIISFALAAVLMLALGTAAYAVWSIHAARQQELKADLKIEENKVSSYIEYDVSEEAKGVVLLSTVNDGESQRVFVNVSPIEKEVIERFPESVSLAWKLDGMTIDGQDYWMTATPKLQSDISVSGHEAVVEAVLRDAYDEASKTLTLECFISNNAIAQAQAYENSDSVHLTLTLWDHQAQADAGVGSSAEWLNSRESLGSVWFTPTEQEMRYFDFDRAVYHDAQLDRDIELVGLELTPFSAVWKVDYEGAASFHTPEADQEAYRPWSILEDRICFETKIIFTDGSEFCTGGALTCPYKNGAVNLGCGWGRAINIEDVQRIVLGDMILWKAE